MNFHQSFLKEFNLKETPQEWTLLHTKEDVFSKESNSRYEDISEEELFLESQQDLFISHIPPFDFEKISKNLSRLTVLLPGVSQENLNTEIKDNVLIVRISPPCAVMLKDESYRNLHKGIFEILKPDRPFEGKFRLPTGSRVKNIVLENGLLQVDIQSL